MPLQKGLELLFDVDPNAMRREGAIVTPATFVDVVKAVDRYYAVQMPRRRRRPSSVARSSATRN